jgi:hypothetical protein
MRTLVVEPMRNPEVGVGAPLLASFLSTSPVPHTLYKYVYHIYVMYVYIEVRVGIILIHKACTQTQFKN